MYRKNIHTYALIVVLALVAITPLYAEEYFFYLQFTDKNNTPYSLSNPSDFLSQRAIDRRVFFGIECDSTDLPVNPAYISALQNLNAKVIAQTKWMNGATVVVVDSAFVMPQLRALPFVKGVEYTGKRNASLLPVQKKTPEDNAVDYGNAYDQINQLKGLYLHNRGYRGEGIHIAVIDAGFRNVDIDNAFDSLRNENRLLGTKDFVNPPSGNLYAEDSHGARVLSTMATNVPDSYIGTAPKASYWLLRTETNSFEYPIECDWWISAVEFADSAGVDVVNTSLGYSEFTDASMNFTYADMDGETIRASRAANIASQKAMIIVNAAGNEGDKLWRYITSPADAKGIITVGGVTSNGNSSVFSSYGPTSDGRIKPEISARGTATWIADLNNGFTTGGGTSYASPIIAGMMVRLLQAAKENNLDFDLATLFDVVFRSANQYNNTAEVDYQKGYGIPNFQTVWELLTDNTDLEERKDASFIVTKDKDNIVITLSNEDLLSKSLLRIYSLSGNLLLSLPLDKKITTIESEDFPKEMLLLSIYSSEKVYTQKIMP